MENMATIKDFYQGARPKTLSAAISPILIGVSLAIGNNWSSKNISTCPSTANCVVTKEYFYSIFNFNVAIACLIVSLSLQIGVNYANDYSDGKKGTDDVRVGPMRLVGSGIASAKSVFIAMCISFFVASIAGIYVASQSSWWLILIGIFCIALAYLYTGTKFAYGYFGFGEIVVFICFGLVATVGTFYSLTGRVTALSIAGSVIPGMFSVSILLANNIRDIETDRESNKKTLPARIGKNKAQILFTISLLLVVLAIGAIASKYDYVIFVLVISVFLGGINRKMRNAKTPKDYISILVATSKFNLITSVLVSVLIFASIKEIFIK